MVCHTGRCPRDELGCSPLLHAPARLPVLLLWAMGDGVLVRVPMERRRWNRRTRRRHCSPLAEPRGRRHTESPLVVCVGLPLLLTVEGTGELPQSPTNVPAEPPSAQRSRTTGRSRRRKAMASQLDLIDAEPAASRGRRSDEESTPTSADDQQASAIAAAFAPDAEILPLSSPSPGDAHVDVVVSLGSAYGG